ncbi:rifin [Plasmodium sp. gorilla clade G1]|nr:PIR protein, putative [Plasmodium sp.]SOS81620.1 rifin [Plasmodium sp. gorilla clade G1]
MKVHYINILLFALPLNILVTLSHGCSPKVSYITSHTPINKPSKSHRSLCECELYAPQNYDNDPEMKEVMENFDRQTSKRFHEYDERVQEKRQKCKEQFEKDIQKIVLKDKIEKELTQKLSALHTNITTRDIPKCVCEKSLAEKTEKFCLKCGYGLGGALTSWEILGYTAIYGWANFATALAHDVGVKAGINKVLNILSSIPGLTEFPTAELSKMINTTNFHTPTELLKIVQVVKDKLCNSPSINIFCSLAQRDSGQFLVETANGAARAGMSKAASVEGSNISVIENTILNSNTIMIASGITILVIVLVMVVIYLILRYRIKKKMKKKLQYIKLLKE